jgi:hypothetical protein
MARKSHQNYRYKQLSLFPDRLCSAYLVAPDSPQKAFYRIWIESNACIYNVCKESGAKARILDKRSWSFEKLEEAQKMYDRRIKSKTNPDRKSPRKYQLIEQVQHA